MKKEINYSFRQILDLGWKVEFGNYPQLFNAQTKSFKSIEEGNKWIKEKIQEFYRGPKEFLEKMKETIYGDVKSIKKKIESGKDDEHLDLPEGSYTETGDF
jgi:hypothetical protein